MKKEAILLLISVSALLLIHMLLYFNYQGIIVIILILIGGISTAIGAIIGMRDTFKWLNEGSSDKKEKGKEND